MRLVLDKIEKTQNGNKIAVFEGENTTYEFFETNMPDGFLESLRVGMIIEAEIVDGSLVCPSILIEETNKKIGEIMDRLNVLNLQDSVFFDLK